MPNTVCSRVRQLEELLERVGDRLRVFQQQNLDNVQRAEQETAILTQEIEQHRATNAGLQQHINEIGSERHRLLTVVAGGVSDEVARAELQAAVSARDASVRASLDREQALQSEIAALRAQLLRRDIACSAIGSMHLDRTELDVERDLRHGRPIGEDAIRRLVQELRATRDIAETFRQELAKVMNVALRQRTYLTDYFHRRTVEMQRCVSTGDWRRRTPEQVPCPTCS